MTRIDFGGTLMALFTGFILSAGITGFVLSAGGYQFPAPRVMAPTGAGPAVSVPAVQAPAAAANLAPAEIKVIATDLKFNPVTIQAKVGQLVKIALENKGVIEHDIAFPTIQADKPGASLKVLAKPAQSATLEFTPSAKGSYEYVCTIPGHKEAGMKGTINVID